MRRVPWARAALLAAFVAGVLFLGPSKALAYAVHSVVNYDGVPATNAYLDHINGRLPDEVRTDPSVATAMWNGEKHYYIKNTSYVPESSPRTLTNAITFVYRNAGTTVDGTSLDMTVSMDVTWCHTQQSEAGYCPSFLYFTQGSDYAFMWESYICTMNGEFPDKAGIKLQREGVSIATKFTFSESEGGKPYNGRILMWFHDMDQWNGGRYARESIELLSGFANDVYVGTNTILDTGSFSSGLFRPTGPGDDDGSRTDCIVYAQGPVCRVRWQGENCGTSFRARYPPVYPDIADDVVYAPKKSVASIGGRNGETVGCSGEQVVFKVSQFLPYVVEENKPAVTEFVDELDGRLDPATAKVRVFRQGKDVTGLWDVSVEGQTIRARSKDTREAVLDLLFEVSVSARPGASGIVANRATTHVRTRTTQDVTKVSNTVEFRLVPRLKKAVFEKTLVGTPVEAHGTPTFLFVADVVMRDGSKVSLGAHTAFDGTEARGPDGRPVATAVVDMGSVDPTKVKSIRLREVPVARYRLASVTTPTKNAKVEGEQVTVSMDDLESDEVRARFENRKVTNRLESHNAMAKNTMKRRT